MRAGYATPSLFDRRSRGSLDREMRLFNDFGNRGAINVWKLDSQGRRKSWGEIENRDGSNETPFGDGGSGRDEQPARLMLARSAIAIFPSNFADFVRADRVHRRIVTPIH